MAIRTAIVFKRGSIKDKEKFNLWIDRLVQESPCPGIIVFPEGTRSQGLKSLPLKRGMLHYAFSRKIPVQLVITDGKEDVMEEKRWHIGFGRKLKVGYSELIESQQFEDSDSFFGRVQEEWDTLWQKVYRADFKELPLLEVEEKLEVYTMKMRLLFMLVSIVNYVALTGVLYLFFWITKRIINLSFPLNVVIAILLLTWLGISFFNAFIEEAPARAKQKAESEKNQKSD
eukprot:TRINITY_DN2294_c0_g1_i2.p1 TRINITY_DN2294_c0_g1~~TRINITY_DN2294_c0_g1_i2.p1  ORF type:complete len:265 (-),score=41.31 TRINITY_DN2294_c0_g1_i2:147-833(-)